MLAAALGTFAAADAATWAASQDDQATYAGRGRHADRRSRTTRTCRRGRSGPAVRSIDGVDGGRAGRPRPARRRSGDPRAASSSRSIRRPRRARELPGRGERRDAARRCSPSSPTSGRRRTPCRSPRTARRLALALDSSIVADLTAFPPDVPAERGAARLARASTSRSLLEDADGRLHKVSAAAAGAHTGRRPADRGRR